VGVEFSPVQPVSDRMNTQGHHGCTVSIAATSSGGFGHIFRHIPSRE
jgi:hypothetical protein